MESISGWQPSPVLRSNCGISAGSHRKGGSRDSHRWPRNVIPARQVRCSSGRATQHTSLGGANPATPVVQQVCLRFVVVRWRGRVSSGRFCATARQGEPAGVRRKIGTVQRTGREVDFSRRRARWLLFVRTTSTGLTTRSLTPASSSSEPLVSPWGLVLSLLRRLRPTRSIPLGFSYKTPF